MRELKMQWDYLTQDGIKIGHTLRYDENGRKDVLPFFNSDGKAGTPKDFKPEHRLYGLNHLKDPLKPVFIVEGEKCAYALNELGYQAITNLGGCGQGQLADWSILESFKYIYILPDNDEAGFKYAEGVYNRLKRFKGIEQINLLKVSLKEKGDICDFFKEIPELSEWDEFSSLKNHPFKDALKDRFDTFLKENAETIPASWKFIRTKHKHKLIDFNDFQALKLPKRETLLSPWVIEGSINMIFADRGIGKTFFSLSCALALANGDEFLCYQADKPVPVLYLDGEMQGTAIQSRLKKLSNGKPTKEALTLYTPDCQDNDHTPDLGTKEGREEINECIRATNPRVIFIDNISTFDRTGKENEAESWAPIQEWAIQQRKQGRSIIFIHHANKEGKQRGSHKKEDIMDAVIKLKRPDSDDLASTEGTKILIQYTKARHLNAEQSKDIEATLIDNGERLEWKWEAGDILYRKAVKMLIDKVPIRDIAEDLNISKSTIHRWKKKAQQDNLL